MAQREKRFNPRGDRRERAPGARRAPTASRAERAAEPVRRSRAGAGQPQAARGASVGRSGVREELVKFFGVQCCAVLAHRRPEQIRRVFLVAERLEQFRDLVRWCDRSGVATKVVSPDELARVAATQHHEGICIEATPVRTWGAKDFARRMASVQRGVLVWLEGVDNPHNIGAIMRTSCFFGARGVILQSTVFSALSGATCRVAEGAAEQLDTTIIREGAQLRELLRDGGWSIVATTPHQARSVYTVAWPEKVVLVFGAEGTGVSPASLAEADQRVSVPRLGPIESLNVATCVGVVLTEACRGPVLRGSVRVLGNTPAVRDGVAEPSPE